MLPPQQYSIAYDLETCKIIRIISLSELKFVENIAFLKHYGRQGFYVNNSKVDSKITNR